MTTPIYDDLIGRYPEVRASMPVDEEEHAGDVAMPGPDNCDWCGQLIPDVSHAHSLATEDRASGDELTLIACSPAHVIALRRRYGHHG